MTHDDVTPGCTGFLSIGATSLMVQISIIDETRDSDLYYSFPVIVVIVGLHIAVVYNDWIRARRPKSLPLYPNYELQSQNYNMHDLYQTDNKLFLVRNS